MFGGRSDRRLRPSPSIASLSDDNRTRACRCQLRPRLWLLLPRSTCLRSVGYETTKFSPASRGLASCCCTSVAVPPCRSWRESVALDTTSIFWVPYFLGAPLCLFGRVHGCGAAVHLVTVDISRHCEMLCTPRRVLQQCNARRRLDYIPRPQSLQSVARTAWL